MSTSTSLEHDTSILQAALKRDVNSLLSLVKEVGRVCFDSDPLDPVPPGLALLPEYRAFVELESALKHYFRWRSVQRIAESPKPPKNESGEFSVTGWRLEKAKATLDGLISSIEAEQAPGSAAAAVHASLRRMGAHDASPEALRFVLSWCVPPSAETPPASQQDGPHGPTRGVSVLSSHSTADSEDDEHSSDDDNDNDAEREP